MKLIVLLQLGTPDSPCRKSIRKYLSEFLMDPKVITIPRFFRAILVKGLIIPFRLKKVTGRYGMIWDPEKGSPLRYFGDSLAIKLNDTLPEGYKAVHAMRYGSPSIESVLTKNQQTVPDEIIFVPLFPHETEATTGSIKEEVKRIAAKMPSTFRISWLPVFKDDQGYLKLMAEKLRKSGSESFDKVIFSFHGLPLKQIEAAHKGISCGELGCAKLKNDSPKRCYTTDCYQTAADIAERAGLEEKDYTVAFQSRFGKKWIGPQTEDVLMKLAGEGKSVLVTSPSFLTDCLETSWEIGISFRELYYKSGGAKFEWVSSLNDDDKWVGLLAENALSDNDR